MEIKVNHRLFLLYAKPVWKFLSQWTNPQKVVSNFITGDLEGTDKQDDYYFDFVYITGINENTYYIWLYAHQPEYLLLAEGRIFSWLMVKSSKIVYVPCFCELQQHFLQDVSSTCHTINTQIGKNSWGIDYNFQTTSNNLYHY